MRADISALDLVTAACGIGKMMRPGVDDGAARWRRLVGILVGLRAA